MNWIDFLTEKSLYVKSVLASQRKMGIEKVHFRQLTPVLSRLLTNAPQEVKHFLHDEEYSPAQCFLNWLASIGEIIKTEKGYYTIWSACNLELPKSNEEIGVRYVLEHNLRFLSITSKPVEGKPVLSILDYLYAPDLKETLNQYKSFSENDDLDTIYRFTNNGRQRITKNFNTDELYLAEKRQVFAHGGEKRHYYLAKFQKGWYTQQITNKDFWRVYYALNASAGRFFPYKLEKFKLYTKIELKFKLPQEEFALLSLIGMPKTYKDAKEFYIPNKYLDDAIEILKRLELKEGS